MPTSASRPSTSSTRRPGGSWSTSRTRSPLPVWRPRATQFPSASIPRPRLSSILQRRKWRETPADPTRAPAACCVRSGPGVCAGPCSRLWRQQQLERRERRNAEARRHAPLLELAALHRRRPEDERAWDARHVHEEDGGQGRLHGGHQLELRVLREDPGPALARPVDQPRHHRPHRQRALPRAHDRQGLGRASRQGRDRRTSRTSSTSRSIRASIPTASTRSRGSRA